MRKVILIAIISLFAPLLAATAHAGGAGTCGKGMRWNPETQKCEKKPRRPESGSHS